MTEDDATNDPAMVELTRAGRPRRVRRRRLLTAAGVVTGGALALAAGTAGTYFATLYRGEQPQTGLLALRRATVLLGETLEPVVGATILIEDGHILEVGDDVEVPERAAVLDLSGTTVLPGLIDMHTHLAYPDIDPGEDFGAGDMPGYLWDYLRSFPQMRRQLLDHGVTSVRSLGDELGWVLELRAAIATGELEGPRIFCAGPVLTTPGGHPIATHPPDADSDAVRIPRTAGEAEAIVAELVDREDSVDVIKVVHEAGLADLRLDPHPPAVLAAIVEAAHARDVPVTVHCNAIEDLTEVLEAGADGIEHLTLRTREDSTDTFLEAAGAPWPTGMLEQMAEADVVLDPTLVVEAARRAQDEPDAIPFRDRIFERVREAHEAGVAVVAGSDAAVPGLSFGASLIEEIEAIGACGLPARAALQAATVQAAAALGSSDIGVIAPGRAADLVAVDGDPLSDLSALRRISAVLREGRVVVGAPPLESP